ncbi:MAG: CPBP family intramembrane metalloprotease [Demequinaceae bacterium]|nr:CPBP family intramembrane metalloprotease [Demequinaceae bacterium]
METSSLLRPAWARIAKQAWIVAAVLFVVLAGIRAFGLFGPESMRMWIMAGFLLMWFVPIVFLSKAGRVRTGITTVKKPIWLLWAPLMGAAAGFLIFAIGYGLYGTGPDNWYMSILRSWAIDDSLGFSTAALFAMYAIPSMIFSPIGEEMFFRGFVHESFKERWGLRIGVAASAIGFAAVHGLHHGFQPGHFHLVSGLIWVTLIAGIVGLFTLCRVKGGSIWPAVLCHSAFNLVMAATTILVLYKPTG